MQESEAKELLKKYCAGICSEEEIAILETWYVRQNMSLPEISEVEREKQLDEVWNSLPIHSKKHFFIRLWPRVAAVGMIILAISTGLLFYFFKNTSNKDQISYARDIKPGGDKAVLTLADGSKINLSDVAQGKLAEQSGISISKTADGQLIYKIVEVAGEVKSSNNIEYNTIETPLGGQYQVYLPDGTKVWLNAASVLRYPVKFIGDERRVELKGEGYFEVAKIKNKTFKVFSAEQTIEVLGTHFNVMAYTDEKVIRTTLIEGSVKVSNAKHSKLLIPGEQSVVFGGNEIQINETADTEEVMAWKNGYFKFNENLESIMNKISRWYNVEIKYEFKPDSDLVFAGKISRARDIDAVLKIMEYTGKVHFKVEGRVVTVTK
ncbi:FecR family protein [Pedobacter sp. ASV1-7]|uniref:FecR family protein n=1 Tax=Pedobacter sp. ASV1-7 TaxID=3145237 RepID=UPI0032E86C57